MLLIGGLALSTLATAQNSAFNKMSVDVCFGMSKTFKPTRENYRPGFNLPHLNLGFRYMMNNKFGLKLDFAFDRITNQKDAPAQYEFTSNLISTSILAYANWGNILDVADWSKKLTMLGYGGPGFTFHKVDKGMDKMLNLKMGVTPMYKVSEKLAIFGDASMTFYAMGHWYIDGIGARNDVTLASAGTSVSGIDGYTGALSLGAMIYLGSAASHADWMPNQRGNGEELEALKAKIAKAEKDMMDDDRDGVPNYLDQEPGTAEGANVDTKGRTVTVEKVVDMDGDGVLDVNDFCPTMKGSASANGCPDGDGDGVYDFVDKCPKAAGLAVDNGCPVVKNDVKVLMTKAMKGVQFDNGKATITKKSLPILDEVAKAMLANPAYNLDIKGHTDNAGDPAKNLKLSDDRAKAVKAYLMGKGVAESRMTATGYGDTMPVASNATPKGKAANRRVEFLIKFEQ